MASIESVIEKGILRKEGRASRGLCFSWDHEVVSQEGGRNCRRVRSNQWLEDIIDKAKKEVKKGCTDYTPPTTAEKLTLEEANEMWNKFDYKKSETEEPETAEAEKARIEKNIQITKRRRARMENMPDGDAKTALATQIANEEAEDRADLEEMKAKMEPPTPVPTTAPTSTDSVTDNGTDSVTDLITDNGANSSSGSSTDRPKKAPKAPLPPPEARAFGHSEAGFWPF